MYASNRIMVFDPVGKHLKDIVLPAYNPTCTTWGGNNFDIVFCASGKDKRIGVASDDGGHMYKYKSVTAKGTPKFSFNG